MKNVWKYILIIMLILWGTIAIIDIVSIQSIEESVRKPSIVTQMFFNWVVPFSVFAAILVWYMKVSGIKENKEYMERSRDHMERVEKRLERIEADLDEIVQGKRNSTG